MTSSDYRKLSALLSAMKDGAREAFADVYSMYEKKVYFLCCKILKSKSDAKKLTIDVFNYAYLQFLNFDDAAGFEKWLYSVVFSKCGHFLAENRPEVYEDYTDTDSPDGEQVDIMLVQDADEMMNYPDGIDVSVDMMNTVDSILSELPHKLRVAALLYFFCGFDFDEIAKIEQISYDAVRNRLYKARIRLGTEEHKFSEIGYNVEGMVIFFPAVLAVMASSIVVPGEMAAGVTARTGINCMKQTRTDKPAVPEKPKPAVSDTQNTMVISTPVQPKPVGNGVSQPTKYGTEPVQRPQAAQGMSPAVKALMALVALLVIIGGTIAVTLAIQGNKSTGDVENFENNDVPTTIEITTKNSVTVETTTAKITTQATTEATTQETTETTTQETTEATTQAPVETTAETTVSPDVPDEGAEDPENAQDVNGEE